MIKLYQSIKLLSVIVCLNYLRVPILRAESIESIDQLRNKAEKLYVKGKYDQALTNYLAGYRLACRLDKDRAANLTVDISSIYHMRGNFRLGVRICQDGLLLMSRGKSKPDSVWFKLNSSLGEMYKKLNKQDSSYLYFSRANTIFQKHAELEHIIPDYVIYHYNNQGMMYVRNGAYTEGLSYLTKALSIAERHTTSQEDIALLQNNLGEVYEQLGLFHKALSLRESALKKYSKDDAYKCKIYTGASKDAFQTKSYQEASRYAKKALTLTNNSAQSKLTQSTIETLTLALNRLGECSYMMGDYDQAEDYFNQAINHSKRFYGNKGNIIAESYLGLARMLRIQGQVDNALVYCQQAIIATHLKFSSANLLANPNPQEALSEQYLFEALVLKAELLFQRSKESKAISNLQNAHSTYKHALAVADVMRKSYNALETKWFFATKVRPAYLNAFETAYFLFNKTQKAQDMEQAFSLLERAKAVALTDVTRELLIKPANVSATLLTQERDLQRTITAQKLESSSSTLSPKLLDAQIQLAQLQQQLEKEFPTYYRAKYEPQTVRVEQVQDRLDEHTAYLSYLLSQDALYIAVVTKDRLNIIRKGDGGRLQAALKVLNTSLYSNPGLGNYTGTSAAISGYRWLIEPITTQLEGKDRWIISRDGDLHRLPFEVLETGRVVDDFLVKKYAISYVLSANTLLTPFNRPSTSTTNTLLGLAPFAKPLQSRVPQLSLPYLPASQVEVEQLPGETFLGKVATKHRFMRNYTNYNILHMATHAYTNEAEPARSYIAFYPDGSPDKLYTEEIHNLSLPHTRLVVLSACETGNGKLQAGEGVMSLAQGFAYAGCPSVVSTLWSAHDESMAYLSQQLYKHLQAGLPADVALQRTRLDYFQSALYLKLNHPHYWANLTLTGDNQPVYAASWQGRGIVVTTLFLALCVGGFLLFRQRNKLGRLNMDGLWQ